MRAGHLVIGTYRAPRGRRLASPVRTRRCVVRSILRCAAVLVLLGLLAAGGNWLLTAPFFAVSRVETGPYRFSNRLDVEAALSACLNRNIWSLTRRDAVAACGALAWVREVKLERRLPGTVMLELVEWQPLLAVPADDGGPDVYYLIGDGRLLALPQHLRPPVLPLLVGGRLQRTQGPEARLAAADPIQVLAVVEALNSTGLESACPVDFVRLTPEGFVLVLQGRCGSLLLGHEDFEIRLARYLLARSGIPEGSIVDLRFEDRITVVPPSTTRA